jgi:predicted small secreted protein
MKKFFYMGVLVLMAALTLTSCGSDDNKKDEPSEPTPTSKSVSYEATASFSQDVLDICDLTMSYKDSDGKTVTETVTSTTWTKKVTVKNLPSTVGVKFGIKMKSGVELTKDKYDAIITLVNDVIVDGKSKGNTSPKVVSQSQGVRAANVADILSKKDGMMFGYDISASGAAVATTNVGL